MNKWHTKQKRHTTSYCLQWNCRQIRLDKRIPSGRNTRLHLLLICCVSYMFAWKKKERERERESGRDIKWLKCKCNRQFSQRRINMGLQCDAECMIWRRRDGRKSKKNRKHRWNWSQSIARVNLYQQCFTHCIGFFKKIEVKEEFDCTPTYINPSINPTVFRM